MGFGYFIDVFPKRKKMSRYLDRYLIFFLFFFFSFMIVHRDAFDFVTPLASKK